MQKQSDHSFSLSSLIITRVLLLAACYALLAGCSFNPMVQGKGEAAVQGEWKQDTSALQNKLVTYSLYNFKFNCDSFFVQIKTYSKVNTGADTCTSRGKWAEYTKGTYALSNDTLKLNGLFCTPDYNLKKEGGCFRFGVYEEHFKIKKMADSVYQFLNLSTVTPFKLHLKNKITCIPKPL